MIMPQLFISASPSSSVGPAHDLELQMTEKSEDLDQLIDVPASVSTGANLAGMHNYLAMCAGALAKRHQVFGGLTGVRMCSLQVGALGQQAA